MELTIEGKPTFVSSTIEKLYRQAVKKFLNSKYVSTAKIQREMRISYALASVILDEMVVREFLSPRIGSWPCQVLKGKHKDLQKRQAILLTNLWMRTGYHPNQKEFLT